MHDAAVKRGSKLQLEKAIVMKNRTKLTTAMCSLLALGLVACGGGGGGDGGNPNNTPPASSKAKINESNAKQVAQSTTQSTNASKTGAQSGQGAFGGTPQTSQSFTAARGLATKALADTGNLESCTGGGTRDFTFEDLPTDPTQLPGAIVVTSVNCIEDGVTSNGVMRLSDFVMEDSRQGFSITFDTFSVLDSVKGLDSTLQGVMTFLLETTATTEKVVFGVTNLEVKEGSEVVQLPRLETVVETNTATNQSTTSLSGSVKTPEGLVDLVTEQPFVSLGEGNPTAGKLKIVGELSSVTLVPSTDGVNVDLHVDNDDVDPAVDAVVPATWEELGPLL